MPQQAINILSIVAELQDLPPERWQERLASITLTEAERKEVLRCLDRVRTAVNFLSGIGRPADDLVTSDPATRPATAPPAVEPHVPQLDGYRITGRLGEGGMGVVWRAEQLSTHRQVALKLMSVASFGSERAKARFNREVELTARLEHPNIARVYDGGLNRGVYFYAMELLEGLPLDEYVEKQQPDQRAILQLFQTICNAVQHAHQRGIIHRDLKPSNIVVTADGQPHVLDFGLAKSLLHDGSVAALSLDGEVAGTPAFMSPEQAAGRLDHIDTRTDVYSLGVILYQLLTGRNPHDLSGTYLDVIKRIVDHDVPSPRSIAPRLDRELEALLLKPLAKDPEQRYASAGEFAADIGRYLAGEPLRARPATLRYVIRKRLAKHRVSIGIAAVVLVLLAGMAAYAWTKVAHERQQRQADRKRSAPQLVAATRGMINQGAMDAAGLTAQLAVEYDPALPEARLVHAALLIDAGRFDQAVEHLGLYPTGAASAATVDKLKALCARSRNTPRSQLAREIGVAFNALQLYKLADHQFATAGEVVESYRARVEAAWPGAGTKLIAERDGRFTLEMYNRKDIHTFEPIRGMPLTTLRIIGLCNVSDLSPLRGMPLEDFSISSHTLTDLSALRGMKLTRLAVSNCKALGDLRPVAGMPLEMVWAHNIVADDLTPIASPTLRILESGGNPNLRDLTPLKACRQLERLVVSSCRVQDLSPLAGLKLVELSVSNTNVMDLSPLRGMPLQSLSIDKCQVHDLSPLAGMPLKLLRVHDNPVPDLSPVASLPIERLIISPHRLSHGLDALRKNPNVRFIATGETEATQLAADFWKRYDAGELTENRAQQRLESIYHLMRRGQPTTYKSAPGP